LIIYPSIDIYNILCYYIDIMIPASIEVKKGEVFESLSVIADQACYTGAKIGGTVKGDVQTVGAHGCGYWYPPNTHVLIEEGGIVEGNVFANHVIVGGWVGGKIVAEHVTILPGGKVDGEIASRQKVEGEYDPPLFLKEYCECTDPTVIALRKLEEEISGKTNLN
jgi:hypothetical protein